MGAPPIPGLGHVWVDVRGFAQIAQGVMGTSKVITSKRTIPITPTLLGLAVTYQMLRSNASGAQLSNPGTLTLFAK